MSVTIPRAGGVPGISGPPNWFSAPPGGSFRLDDVNWRGAVKRTFGGGGSLSISFRGLHQSTGSPAFIYLSFWAAFVQELADERDSVFLGLQPGSGGTALVIHLRAHPSTPAQAGPPPDTHAPINLPLIEAWTRASGATSWTPLGSPPAWVSTHARGWVQDATHVGGDPNHRWAVQLRVPLSTTGDVTNASGPNLGTNFKMWYYIRGSAAGSSVELADSRTSGVTTALDLLQFNKNFPAPTVWEDVELATGAAAFGGIALQATDVVVQNAVHGTGTKIANGTSNTFIARPRNYQAAGNDIAAGAINATFRIANWGSVAGNPHQIDFSSGAWDYVPGNGPLQPVASTLIIPTLPAGSNPPATSPIAHSVVMNLPPGKSLHQCVLVTLSGNNQIFLNDSVFRNMDYDTASLLAREAEINIVDLDPISEQPRDVYLAVEKINLLATLPGEYSEGTFLEASMRRLIEQGGPLAEKLKQALAILSKQGGDNSDVRLDDLLEGLRRALADLPYLEIEVASTGMLPNLISSLRNWLVAVRREQTGATRLADLFNASADWLEATPTDALNNLNALVDQFNRWMAGLGNDPSLRQLSAMLAALRGWLFGLVDGERFRGFVEQLLRWFEAGQPASQLPDVNNALREMLRSLSTDGDFAAELTTFTRGVAGWLSGEDRLLTLIEVLEQVGLTPEEIDQLFPTLRIHVYIDTGERIIGSDGVERPALRIQPTFGLHAYHEGSVVGWQTSLQGAQRVADNLYLLAAPNKGTAKVTVNVQAVEPGEERIPEDPIRPIDRPRPEGCLPRLLRVLRTLLGGK
ncbi:MAG: hypothetical protein KF893_09140 [Caldilineaceae bacterium]|nr:hypothetical protein [Caldilineaceae bacterium]